MRRRTLLVLGLLGFSLLLAIARKILNLASLDWLAGLGLLAAGGVALSLLPIWARLRGPPMPGLFERPERNQRWCVVCGLPAPQGPCPRCRTVGRRRRRAARLQGK